LTVRFRRLILLGAGLDDGFFTARKTPPAAGTMSCLFPTAGCEDEDGLELNWRLESRPHRQVGKPALHFAFPGR
jgi:hypothetical protein